MMNGYDKQEAQLYILSKLDIRQYKVLEKKVEELVSSMIDLDMQFMHETGVIDEQGNAGGAYYEDDDAFEYILEGIAVAHKMSASEAMAAASLLDDFFDGQQAYLELKGLVDWD